MNDRARDNAKCFPESGSLTSQRLRLHTELLLSATILPPEPLARPLFRRLFYIFFFLQGFFFYPFSIFFFFLKPQVHE